jgi:hypothetical protein
MEILAICMPIFIIIFLGKVLLNFKIIDHNYINASNKVVMNFFLPVLLFSEIAKSNFREVFSPVHMVIFLGSIILMYLISLPLSKLLKLPITTTKTFICNIFRANSTFIGLPVCFYAFGGQGLSIASIYLAFMIPVNNILAIMAHGTGEYKLTQIKDVIRSTFLNPLIIACLLGLIFSITSIPLPVFITRTLTVIAGVALPLALLGIGANINLEHLKGNKKIIAISSIMKLLIMPLIVFILLKLFANESFGLLEKVAVILLASPSAQTNYIFAAAMEGDTELASGGIIFSTILSALTFILWIGIMNT